MSYYDLGSYTRKITTASAEAQTWFDRGMNWIYGFNHGEAIACFQKALAGDPGCAMAYWGIAYATGPNYNQPWNKLDPVRKAKFLGAAFDATQAALARIEGVSPVEAALIRALVARYPQREAIEDQSGWDKAFTAAMRPVFKAHPADLEVRAVFADAILNEAPWKLWNLGTGKPAEGTGTPEAVDVLESGFRDDPRVWDHPGLLHLYIHLMEMSPFPQRALRAADRLRDLVPDAGHLIHMPTHIYVLCGNYHDAMVYNQKAQVADRKYLKRDGPMNAYTVYRTHDHHFVVYGALFLGQYAPAMQAAQELIDTTPEELLRSPHLPMADLLEGYLSIKQHVLVRFGKWQDIIAQELPLDRELYCSTTAVMLYAKSVAHSALGQVPQAEQAREAFLEAKWNIPKSRRVHNNMVVDLLAVAEAMLDGELEYRRGNHDLAFAHLRRSVQLADELPYDEPWGWMQPPRHALGALLLEQGRAAEAEDVYRSDLGLDGKISRPCQHPENVWSLHGLHECLTRRGESVEARLIKQWLDLAVARSDVLVRSSCFCRRQVAAPLAA